MQHPWDSFLESLVNILIGFVISMTAYAWIINPLFNLNTNPFESFGIVSIFTVFSLIRQFVLRRVFDGKSPYVWIMLHIRGE